MWMQLMHKLFGWEYILLEWGYGYTSRKVRTWPSGVKTVDVYGDTFILYTETQTVSGCRKYKQLT